MKSSLVIVTVVMVVVGTLVALPVDARDLPSMGRMTSVPRDNDVSPDVNPGVAGRGSLPASDYIPPPSGGEETTPTDTTTTTTEPPGYFKERYYVARAVASVGTWPAQPFTPIAERVVILWGVSPNHLKLNRLALVVPVEDATKSTCVWPDPQSTLQLSVSGHAPFRWSLPPAQFNVVWDMVVHQSSQDRLVLSAIMSTHDDLKSTHTCHLSMGFNIVNDGLSISFDSIPWASSAQEFGKD